MRAGDSSKRFNNITSVILLAVSLLTVAYISLFTAGDDIWYDEVFSMGFIRGGLSDIVGLTAMDVHPPLYYIYLKAVTSPAVYFAGSGCLIPAAKIASILPWFGVFAMGLTYVRKRYGLSTACFFIFLMTVMPQLATYYVEIRMYSLGLMLITGAVLTADRIMDKDRDDSILLWVLFCILGIMTAYTQYYACIGIAGIYAAMLVIALLRGTEHRAKIRKLLICAVISACAYIPWLPVLKSQMSHISGNYWIQPLTLRSIPGCIKFIVLPVAEVDKIPYILAGLLVVAIGYTFICFILKKDRTAWTGVILGLSPLVCIIAAGFILSLTGTPIFVYRYMVPALGGLWLVIAVIAGKALDGRKILILMIPCIAVGAMTIYGFRGEEGKKVTQMEHAGEVMAGMPADSVIITNFDHVTSIMGYYMPDHKVYLYDGEVDGLIPAMYDSVSDSLDDEGVEELVRSENDVYFLGSFNSREDIVAAWSETGIESELMDSMLIERYWINIYRLSAR